MSDELKSKLRAQSESWAVPKGDYRSVERRGRFLMWRRRLASSAVATAIGAAAVLFFATGGAEEDPPPPNETFPVSSDADDADAATFAYHALLEGGRYQFDYKDVEQEGDQWVVTFKTSGSIADLREYVKSRRSFVNQGKREIEKLRKELGQTRDGARRERLVRQFERQQEYLREFENDLEQGIDDLRELVAAGGTDVVRFRVGSEGGVLVVRDIEGAEHVANVGVVRAFTEPAAAIDPGMEFRAFKSKELAGGPRSLSTAFAMWWAGPIPSPMRELCRPVARNENGGPVFGQNEQETGYEAPPMEDMRDGGVLGPGFTLPKGVDPDGLALTMECRTWRGKGWVSYGEVAIEDVPPKGVGGTGSGGSIDLDPDRHVMVSTRARWIGEDFTGMESICIARVFDKGGEEIGTHGTTLYGTFQGVEEAREGQALEIPVDVGDPERADYAVVDCQKTIPGVLLGPDQTP